jgi:hypothetical protein
MLIRILAFALAALVAASVSAQYQAAPKQRVEKAADLPRFNYRIDGKVEDLLRDDAKFKAFAAKLRADIDSVLAKYEIPDKAVERGYLGTLAQLDYLEGRYDDAMLRIERMRALEEKPADKLLTGLTLRAMIMAERKVGSRVTDAYRQEVGQMIREALDKMPFPVVQNEVKEIKASAEIVGEPLIVGSVRERLQPIVDKAGALSSEFAPGVVNAKYRLAATVPLKPVLVQTYTSYLAANKVDKPDIWKARDISLPASGNYAPVNIAAWTPHCSATG